MKFQVRKAKAILSDSEMVFSSRDLVRPESADNYCAEMCRNLLVVRAEEKERSVPGRNGKGNQTSPKPLGPAG
jgi:hypothetical protein